MRVLVNNRKQDTVVMGVNPVFSGMEGAIAMKVTSTGSQTIHKAAGDSVILNCSYTPGPLDTGELDIEWSVVSPDSTQKDQMVRSAKQRSITT